MRSFGFRLSVLVAILWVGIGSTARAVGYRDTVETVYVMPTSVSLPVPTSYVVSTSWVEPTAYAVPTYYTTAYWIDPVVVAQPTYVPTAYVRRRGLFGRRWVVERPVVATYTTSYLPTTYVASTPAYRSTSYVLSDPLVVPSSYVASAECVCPPALASAAPTYAAPSRGTGAGATGSGTRSGGVRSEVDDRASRSSNVGPPPEDLNPAGTPVDETNPNANAAETTPNPMPDIPSRVRDTSPPPPPAPAGPRPSAVTPGNSNPQGGATGTTPGTGNAGPSGGPAANVRPRTNTNSAGGNAPAGNAGAATGNAPANAGAGSNAGATGNAGAVAPPAAPADDLGVPPPIGPSGEVRSQSMKPSTYAIRPIPAGFRNVLMGTVNSGSAGEPEEDVQVGVRNIRTGARKSTTTNAFGRFAVRLTDGDWAVDVTMPSGRVYEVSRLRVNDGLIVDSLGRRVPTLDITR